MKKYLFFSLFIIGFVFAQAQVTYAPNPFFISGDANGVELRTELLLTQTYADEVELFWKLRKVGFPPEWETSITDTFCCYQGNLDKSSEHHGNWMQIDSTYHWAVHLNPWYTSGYDTVYLELYDDNEFLNLVKSIPIILDIGPSAILELNMEEIQVFPNPTSNQIQLEGDENVVSMVFYDIVGKEVKRESHIFGEIHDVSNLQNGVYLMQLFDNTNRIIGVTKMIKE